MQQQHRHGNAPEAFGVWEKSAIIKHQTGAPDGSQAAGNSLSKQASRHRTTWPQRCRADLQRCSMTSAHSPDHHQTLQSACRKLQQPGREHCCWLLLAVCWLFAGCWLAVYRMLAVGFFLNQHL